MPQVIYASKIFRLRSEYQRRPFGLEWAGEQRQREGVPVPLRIPLRPSAHRATIFKESFAQVGDFFKEFLSYNTPAMTFAFTSAGFLSNFSELFNAATTPFLKMEASVYKAVFTFHYRRFANNIVH